MAHLQEPETTVAVTASIEADSEGWSVLVQVIIGLCFSAMVCLNIIGNTMTIIAFARDRALQTVQNMYIVNLAVTDLTIGVISLPPYGVYTVMYYAWPFGYPFCKAWSVIDFWACAESSLTIILISYDRLLMVTQGIEYNQQQTKRRAGIKIAMTWFVSFLLYSPAILGYDIWRGYSTVEEGDCDVEFASEMIFTLVTAVIEFMIPFVLLTLFNLMLFADIRRRSKKVRDMHAAKTGKAKDNVGADKSLARNVKRNTVEAEGKAVKAGSNAVKTDGNAGKTEGNAGNSEGNADTSKGNASNTTEEKTVEDNTTTSTNDQGTATSGIVKTQKEAEKNLNRDKKAAKALATLVLAYAICWTPYTIATIILSVCEECVNMDVYAAFNLLLWTNSSFNACIYAYTNELFRARFKALLGMPWCKTKNNTSNVITVQSVTGTTSASDSALRKY